MPKYMVPRPGVTGMAFWAYDIEIKDPDIKQSQMSKGSQYFLYYGLEYDGEFHVGIYETLASAFKAFDKSKEKHHADYGVIYTIKGKRLVQYLRWQGWDDDTNKITTYQWRKVK